MRSGIGNEKVVAHDLDLPAQGGGHLLPGRPVVFIQPVFNGHDRGNV